jgi:hypothetical protein
MSPTEDYLMLGERLVEHLNGQITDCKTLSLDSLETLDKSTFRGLAVFVMFAGEAVPTGVGNEAGWGAFQQVEQYWLTVVSVQTAGQQGDGRVARKKAGPILAQVGKALQGHAFAGFRPLRRVTPPAPRYVDGFAHFPLLWRAECSL